MECYYFNHKRPKGTDMTRIEIYDHKKRMTVRAGAVLPRNGFDWIRWANGHMVRLDAFIDGCKSFHWNKNDNRMVIYR